MALDTPLQGFLFDLDGTLLDTSADLIASCNSAVREFGLLPLAPEKLKPQISGGAWAMLQLTINSTSNRSRANIDTENLHSRMLDLYEENISVHTRLYAGIEKVLGLLQAREIPWGIVTNKVERFTRPLIRKQTFNYEPGCVISGDSLPEKKPHPLPMLEASRQLGCRPEHCAYIGDARRDIEAGRNAGMATLAASYGYVDESDPVQTWGADVVIDHPHQVIDWLLTRALP